MSIGVQSYTQTTVVQSSNRTGTFILHGVLAVLFGGIALAFCGTAWMGLNSTQTQQMAMFACLILAFVCGMPLWFFGGWRPSLLLLDAIVLLILLAGVPGMLLTSEEIKTTIGASLMEAASSPTTRLAFLIALLARTYLLYFQMPRSLPAIEGKFENMVMGWLYVTVTGITMGSVYISTVSRVSFSTAIRLGADLSIWINMNSTALYACMCILLGLFIRFIPLVIRIAVAGLGTYVLVLTQSRMTMLALVGTVAFYLALTTYRRWFRSLLFGLTALAILIPLTPVVLPEIIELRPVRNIMRRNARTDPTTGRLETIDAALERVSHSPLIGFGYQSAGSRFENGLLSMAMEGGFLQVGLYLIFTAMIVLRAIEMLRWKHDPRAQNLAQLVLCLTVFMFIRSIGERNHAFQVTNIVPNAWMLLSSYLVVYRVVLARETQTETNFDVVNAQFSRK